MTAKQKAAREKFKKVVAEAGKLRKKNPKLTQAQAVKQAFAMQKKVGAIKIIEKGETKSAKAKAVYQQVRTKKGTFKGLKKVGAVKKSSSASFYKQQKAFEKQKKVNDAINKKFANWNYPVPPVYTGNWTVKTWTDYITKNGSKIGAIKKSAPKKVASKRITDIHKDSKSHNVNIRVLSGIKSQNKKILKNISIAEDELYDVEIDIINERLDLKNAIISKDKNLIKYEKDSLEFSTKLKKELIAHIKELKKLL